MIKTLKKVDHFSQGPMVALLPTLSQLDKLKSLRSFIYARYEKVAVLRDAAVAGNTNNDAIQAEYAMLLEILDWLKMTPTKE